MYNSTTGVLDTRNQNYYPIRSIRNTHGLVIIRSIIHVAHDSNYMDTTQATPTGTTLANPTRAENCPTLGSTLLDMEQQDLCLHACL